MIQDATVLQVQIGKVHLCFSPGKLLRPFFLFLPDPHLPLKGFQAILCSLTSQRCCTMWCCLLSGSIFPLFDEAQVSCRPKLLWVFVFDE